MGPDPNLPGMDRRRPTTGMIHAALLLAGGLLAGWIDVLSHREKEVLEGRFGLHDREPETLEVLSERLGLTRERVRQIQNEAMLKLKRHMVRSGVGKEALF